MDKTLKRPLFKQKAMEAYKAKHGGKIPGYAIGSAIMSGIRTAAAPTFRFLKTNPTVRTAFTGLEGYGLGLGAGIAGEGYQEGDYGKMLEGLSFALPAGAFIPASARGSGIAALRETAEYLTPRATGLQKAIVRNPGKTAVGSIGTGVTGALLSSATQSGEPVEVPEGMSNEDYLKDLYERTVFSDAKFKKDDKGKVIRTEIPEEERVPGGPKFRIEGEPRVPVGIKDPRTEGERTLDKQYKQVKKATTINEVAKKLGITDASTATDQQIKQIAIESNVPEKELRSVIGREVETNIGTPSKAVDNPAVTTEKEANAYPGMTDVELQNAVNRRKKTLGNAKQFSNLSEGFRDFKSELQKMTGTTNESLNDLIAMKVAAKLLTGKTSERGFAGFADVAGQALGVGADSLLALKLAQQDQDMKLAQAFIKMKTDKSKGPGFVAGDKTYRISNPAFPGGFYNAKAIEGKDGRQYYRTPDNQIVAAGPGTTGNQIPINAKDINLFSANLEELKRGQDMITQVLKALPETGTTNAAFQLVKEDVIGTIRQTMGMNGLEQGGSFDSEIIELLNNNNVDDEDTKKKLIEEYRNSISDNTLKKRASELAKESGKSGFFKSPTDQELERFTKLALIEQRMKYIVANANKSQDRLTQKDIENAEKRTKIIQFFGSERTVYQNYKRLQEEFIGKAQSDAMNYRRAGGTEDGMQYFIDTVPGVNEMYQENYNKAIASQQAKNKKTRNEVLGSIPIGG